MAEYETELKLQITTSADGDKILEAPVLTAAMQAGTRRKDCLEARYYDTADGSLRMAGWAYRVRCEAGAWVATVKGGGQAAGGLHKRLEYNIAVAGPEPDLAVFSGTPAGKKLRSAAGASKLKTVMLTRFERETALVVIDGSTIEVAVDKGEIIAGHQRSPILEIELELKAGTPTVLLLTGAKLAEQFSLLLEPRSKFARGLALAGLAAWADQPAAGPVINRVHRLLAAQAALWHNPAEQQQEQQLLDISDLQQLIAGIAAYDGLKPRLADWRAVLEQAGTIDSKKTIPLLLTVWAIALDL
ncbi:CYTH domain-containing protein|uniref:CYTH domain-containing protein n=1 Tax=Dendrosporobacter quercicolus TaxID=146817 RepID=A0A1G9Q392_9FIRM|nr:CYTH domain-containing protein [Dendrosporobacter quercicolus]NSL48105.1 CYTH domain-containing protein [Dendrosporobacter quercicolus DSM 1736]SDM05508.1 CYTH domain-containing protein [Dendrosporobacter quercicolus]